MSAPCARVSVFFPVFLHHFLLAKLATSSIRLNPSAGGFYLKYRDGAETLINPTQLLGLPPGFYLVGGKQINPDVNLNIFMDTRRLIQITYL